MKTLFILNKKAINCFSFFCCALMSTIVLAAQLGINTTIEDSPMDAHLTSGINHLAFTYQDNQLNIGSVQRNQAGQKIVKYLTSDGRQTELSGSENYLWLNPNKNPSEPYLEDSSFLLEKLNFNLSDDKTHEQQLTVASLFKSACQDEGECSNMLQMTFGVTEEQANDILEQSIQPVRCTLKHVMLKDLAASPYQQDEGRYQLKIEVRPEASPKANSDDTVGSSETEMAKNNTPDWADSEATITVAAPGYGIIMLDEACWALSTNACGQTIRSNFKVGDEVPLYAKLAIIGLRTPHATCDGRRMMPGARLDLADKDKGRNIAFTFGKIGENPVFETINTRDNEVGDIPASLTAPYSNISTQERNNTAAIIKDPYLLELTSQVLARRAPLLGAFLGLMLSAKR